MANADNGSTDREDQPSIDRLQDLERFVHSVQDGLSQLTSLASIHPPSDTGKAQRKLSNAMPTDHSGKENPPLSMPRRPSSSATHGSSSSFETMLKLAQSTLADNSFIPSINEEVFRVTSSAAATPKADSPAALVRAGHSILALGEPTAKSLLDTFASHICIMYPCVDMAVMQTNLAHLHRLESSSGPGATPALRLIDIEILKAVMTVGASANSSEPSVLVQILEQSLLWPVENVGIQEFVGIDDVIMSCLMVSFPRSDCAPSFC